MWLAGAVPAAEAHFVRQHAPASRDCSELSRLRSADRSEACEVRDMPEHELGPKKRSWTWHLALLFVGFLVAYLAAQIPAEHEASVRTAGGVLQVLGLFSVALGISEVRRSFGLPGTVAEVLSEFAQSISALLKRAARLFGHRPGVIVGAGVASLGFAAGRARATVRSGPGATIEQRLSLLETLVGNVENDLWKLHDTLDADREQVRKALDAERATREQRLQAVDARIFELGTGGVRLQTVGLVWLFVSIILATWSQELAPLAGR